MLNILIIVCGFIGVALSLIVKIFYFFKRK
ncbi:hypothetical protein S2091_0710 [Solimicrobium silvestre]|uniref:Uncharacterized protein n=1 Tax=Solimicrobium silvestre TaxID=2099400 RepID=A0A2S9H408_9BURK|nr:hypothetical protein S2091_0710 [Solimicrobium silvestre]